MQLFLQALHQEQDIIIDLPPMSLSSDVQAVGHLLDGVILLAEADRTTLEDLNEAYRTLRAANTRVLGVVLNKVTIRAGRTRRQPRFRFRPAWSIRR
jgi:Mrp family chromosome partitioning ATPase